MRELSVRPEYAALATEFERLAAPFGHLVDDRLRRDIARLASAIERIDRLVDEAPDDEERRMRWRCVIARMRAGGCDHPCTDGFANGAAARSTQQPGDDVPAELRDGADELRAIGEERGVLERLRRIVAKEAKTSEALRVAGSGAAFVPLVLREGRLTAALALVVAGAACGKPFRRFFFRLGGPANLVDKIKDARGDHARGEISIRPSPSLYARLVSSLLIRGAALVASHPRPLSVVLLGLRYLA